ncbi:site-2 protease family protein [Nocardia uniformis]|uniref:site-2 protease family protein n=1 Tax=Nocardia uniformis TaxID=53432 RepID=UPI000AB0B505|nr:site-2 protease family protein [Nocardia uniformis]
MRATIPLGQVAGIRIGAHWSALVTVGLFAWVLAVYLDGTADISVVWISAVAGALALCASLLGHELAHAIVARRNGVRVDHIVLWLLGGVAELAEEPPNARADLRIALAGPATSLVIGATGLGAAALTSVISPNSPITAVLIWLATMNIVLAVFNMLPGAPLDGGRVLRAIVWWRTRDRLRAAVIAARAGQILGTALIILGIAELWLFGHLGGVWLALLGWFLRTAAHTELVVAGMRHRLGDTRVHEVMTARPIAVRGSETVGGLLRSEAVHTNHRVFPVVDDSGRPVAVIAWPDVLAVPELLRDTTLVRAIARRLPASAIAHADEHVADAAARTVLRPNLDAIAVIDGDGRLSGVVTATDLALACTRSALGLPIGVTGERASDATADQG